MTLINHAPVSHGALAIYNYIVNSSTTVYIKTPDGTFSDPDGDVLSYSARLTDGSDLPAWLTFDAANNTFYGTPPLGYVDNLDIEVTATDGAMSRSVRLYTNDVPTIVSPIADQIATVGTEFYMTFSTTMFQDVDPNDNWESITLSLADGSHKPDWLTWSSISYYGDVFAISGTAALADIGTFSLKLTFSDMWGSKVSDIFDVKVKAGELPAINHAPVVKATIADYEYFDKLGFGDPAFYGIPQNTFVDPDGDALSYSATLADGSALPSWLVFEPLPQLFIGTPPQGTVGNIELKVTATDGYGESVSTTFTMKFGETPVGENGGSVPADGGTTYELPEINYVPELPELPEINYMHELPEKKDGDEGSTVSYAASLKSVRADLEKSGGNNSSATYSNLTGSDYNDRLIGNTDDNILTGGAGKDRLTGRAGSDTFVFATGTGKDRITDFDAVGSDHDAIDLSGMKGITNFEDLMQNHVREVGRNLIISGENGDRIFLNNVDASQIDAGDFLF